MFQKALQSSLVSIQGFVVDQDTWFLPKPGLNVVYGKNGVGKSTLINFIEAIGTSPSISRGWDMKQMGLHQDERKTRSQAERGAGRVVVNFTCPGLVALADYVANEIKNANRSGVRRIRVFSGRWGDEYKQIAESLTQEAGNELKWSDEKVYESIAEFAGQSPEEIKKAVNLLRDNADELEGTNEDLLWEITKQILQGKFDSSPVVDISEALRKTVLFHYTEWEPDSAVVSEINKRFIKFGITENFDSDESVLSQNVINELLFGDLFLLFVDVIICRLQYELNDVILDVELYHGDVSGMLSQFDEDNPLTFSSVRTDADDIIGTVARAVFEQKLFLLASYDRIEGAENNRSIRLLFRTEGSDGIGEHTAAFGIGEHTAAFVRLWQSWVAMSGSEEFEDQVCYTWLLDSLVLGYERLDFGTTFTDSLPFYELRFPIGKVEVVPFESFRLDDDLEVDKVVSEMATITLDENLFEALALFKAQAELDDYVIVDDQMSEFVKPLNASLKPVEEFITALGIGIEGFQVEVSSTVGDWIAGKGISLNFDINKYEVGFDRLSTAQQFWVRAGMRLVAAQKTNSRVLILADEPDRSLHERAAYNAMAALGDSGLDVIVSSHSVAALRTRNATLHHLEVDANRRRTVSEVAVGNDVLVAAERLGTTPYDLLSLKRMMVLVEGAHDEAVIGRLLSLSDNKLLSDRVLIAAMRGVKNVVTAADSVLATEFSELSLLVVVDNGRNDVFKPILSELRELDSAGASEKELKRILTVHRKGHDASFEERMLFDLLERAIHRGVLRRLDLFALSVGDVIELLPAVGFGSSLSWEELRKQYQRSGFRTDFKDWLRETQQISVSVRTIEEAFDKSDSVHPELTRLLQEIELGCSIG
jgi:ABC-type phosphate/phosphonate transport system ATPase subunit